MLNVRITNSAGCDLYMMKVSFIFKLSKGKLVIESSKMYAKSDQLSDSKNVSRVSYETRSRSRG